MFYTPFSYTYTSALSRPCFESILTPKTSSHFIIFDKRDFSTSPFVLIDHLKLFYDNIVSVKQSIKHTYSYTALQFYTCYFSYVALQRASLTAKIQKLKCQKFSEFSIESICRRVNLVKLVLVVRRRTSSVLDAIPM